ncbi:hypothetical protein P6F26_07925 [Roseibacterium sp. SDUM158017]|uniref:hypothetical protein n=1 Tax=Roseicyclus salinarum TaxID=3036773 RepID=UPI0024156AC1|nr:hypothetical protein [Roseibacterium sp. SDUM158017]MDG4648370.1 hypothetical protein [Roseibacterium sp. SDUM158017]
MPQTHDPADPKGLIREAFNIEGITEAECRSIFVDWALSVEAADPRPFIETLLARHADAPAGHPMRAVLAGGMDAPPPGRRRGGRRARVTDG